MQECHLCNGANVSHYLSGWLSPDLIRLRYLEVWWSRGARLGPTVAVSAPHIVNCLWRGWDVSLANNLVSCLCSPQQTAEHLGHRFAYVKDVRRLSCLRPISYMTSAGCQHSHPNNAACCSGQFQHQSHWDMGTGTCSHLLSLHHI